MHVRSIRLRDFRSHTDTTVEFDPGLNLLHGPNGAGKTNILEGLHYCCLGKSFLSTSDQFAVRRGQRLFELDSVFGFDSRADAKVRLAYGPSDGKRMAVNGVTQERLVDSVGRFPVVAISPDDHRLTDGGPDERRRFLDTILCQENASYLESLLRYRRVLRQRNELLGRRRGGSRNISSESMAPWNEELARQGARVTLRRKRFLAGFSDYVQAAFAELGGPLERPTIRYRAFADIADDVDEEGLAAQFLDALRDRATQEAERGITIIGPHRDELVFRLDDLEVRRYASQGQHRTFVLALRLAQYRFLHDRLSEYPLLLLDDVFDNLDPERIRIFVELLTGDTAGQVIVTAARPDVMDSGLSADAATCHSVHVVDGTVPRYASAPAFVPTQIQEEPR